MDLLDLSGKKFSQKNRPLAVQTGLGKDEFLLESFGGSEGLSRLFHFQLNLLAPLDKEVPFEKVLGQEVSVRLDLPKGKKRYFNGIVSRFTQGGTTAMTGGAALVRYRAEMVPKFWLWQHRIQSRIFQQKTVEDILKEVLKGLEVTYELSGGIGGQRERMQPRDYCVQYRESDFHFACRLMEEEGIYYYFDHKEDAHKMILGLAPMGHREVAEPSTVRVVTEPTGLRDEDFIFVWEKTQEIRPVKVALRDYCFETSEKDLEVTQQTVESVKVGKVSHKLKLSGADTLEVYDFPGGYAGRFDGITPGGGERPADLQKISEDGKRTAAVRMKQETTPAVEVVGQSKCRQFAAGHKFSVGLPGLSLSNLGSLGKSTPRDGPYVLTHVDHSASVAGTSASEGAGLQYGNTFRCIPFGLPFRPGRVTARPRIDGAQTAVVVGDKPSEEIFTDKYGRVKVQFHWDRHGKKDANSSCWVRVGTLWAGHQWGAVHLPRVGQEVIVAFLDGDPDQPIIVGSVYNDKHMPPYTLPLNKTQSGLKSRSVLKGGTEDFNELRFEDKKGQEDVYFHGQKDFHRVVENDDDLKVGHDQIIEVKNNRTDTVKEGNEKVTVEKGNREVEISMGNEKLTVKQGQRDTEIFKDDTLTIKTGNQATDVKAGKSETKAMQQIVLQVGKSKITISQQGVKIEGLMIQLEGKIKLDIEAPLTSVDAKGMLTLKGTMTMIN